MVTRINLIIWQYFLQLFGQNTKKKSSKIQNKSTILVRVDNSDVKSKKLTHLAIRSFKKLDFVFEIIRVHIINEDPFTKDPLNEGAKLNEIRTKPFLSSFDKYFMDESYCDVEFKFDCGPRIESNRLVLANKLENDLSLDTLQNFYFDSEARHLDDLKDMVIIRIGEMANIHTWDQILRFSLKINEDKLKKNVMLFLQYNWDEVKQTKQMKRMLKEGNIDWISEIENLITTKILGD
ncbi:12659_t:CDS:2 [Cetraspora pellucida]|uniref:12659_t:CDS:1 n=1 Tax=Cetraspora pellucida TaxID=1433469 RepID=A0A9N9J170_9GLOM|nr:12659_t:CDS:2 [Cetraspora pellucida]